MRTASAVSTGRWKPLKRFDVRAGTLTPRFSRVLIRTGATRLLASPPVDVLRLKVGVVIPDDRLVGDAVPDQLQNRLNGNSRARHAGLSKMNLRAQLNSAHVAKIHLLTLPQQAVRGRAWRRGWSTVFDCVFEFTSIATIFVLAVRPKHPPLWRTKFVGLTAFRFWVSTPKCCGR